MNNKSEELWDKVMEGIDQALIDDAAESVKNKAAAKEYRDGRIVSKATEFKTDKTEKKVCFRFVLPVAAAAAVLVIAGIFGLGFNRIPVESVETGSVTDFESAKENMPAVKEIEEGAEGLDEGSKNIFNAGNSVPADLSLYEIDFSLFEKYFVYNFCGSDNSGQILTLNYCDAKETGVGKDQMFMFGGRECFGFLECEIESGVLPMDGNGNACFMIAKEGDRIDAYCSVIRQTNSGKAVILYRYDNIREGEKRSLSRYDVSYRYTMPLETSFDTYPNGNVIGYFGILKLCQIYDLPLEYLNNVTVKDGSYVRNTDMSADWGFAEVIESNNDSIKIGLRFYPSESLTNPKDFLLEFKYDGVSEEWTMQQEVSEFYIAENDIT